MFVLFGARECMSLVCHWLTAKTYRSCTSTRGVQKTRKTWFVMRIQVFRFVFVVFGAHVNVHVPRENVPIMHRTRDVEKTHKTTTVMHIHVFRFVFVVFGANVNVHVPRMPLVDKRKRTDHARAHVVWRKCVE